MSNEAWPLSAAATQLLADLQEDRGPVTTPQTISRLAVKELVLRGHIRILEVQKRRLRSTKVIVSIAPAAGAAQLPAPLALLAARLPLTSGDELSSVIKKTAKHYPTLFTKDLKEACVDDLRRHGLVEDRAKKVMKVWTTTFPAPTERGRNGIGHAHHRIHDAEQLPLLVKTDPGAAEQSALALGALVLLAAGGLAAIASLGDRLRRSGRAFAQADWDGVDFNVIAATVDALGDVIDSISGDIGSAIDSTLDAAVSAIDSGIDSGISDGGGDGGSSGDSGGGCGGGGGD